MLLIKIISLFLSGTLFFSLPIFPMSILSGLFSGEKSYTKHTDIKYGEAERNLIDIYVPKSAYQRDYNGVILFIHGGSWTGGDKKDMNTYCERYAEKGYITATTGYTVVTEENGANAFTMLDEINLAVKKIKEFSNEENLNITYLATCGFSAGGHISSLYAYTRAESCPIKLAFTANKVAPSDFHPSNWDSNYGEGMGYSLACALAGVAFDESLVVSGEIENVIASVSPASYIDENSVPTIAGYGGKDTVCPVGNAYATKAALIKSGIDYEFIFYPKSNHPLWRDPSKDAQYQETFLKYCEKYFGYAPLADTSQTLRPTDPATELDSEIPNSGNNNSSLTDIVTKPENNIPDTDKELQDEAQYGASDQTIADISREQNNNSNNRANSKSGFRFQKEVILSIVLIVAFTGIGAVIVIKRKRAENEN